MPLKLETDGWPLVIVKATGEVSDTDLENFYQRADTLYTEKRSFGLVFDFSEAKGMSTQHINALQEWRKANSENEHLYVRAAAFVISSSIMRVIMKASLAFQPPASPCTAFAQRDEATDWVTQRLATPV